MKDQDGMVQRSAARLVPAQEHARPSYTPGRTGWKPDHSATTAFALSTAFCTAANRRNSQTFL
eukprot:5448533-Pleurochrysis_carterae.AAC.5